jgi:Kef-type K+ transport system membrane component KefB
MHHDPIAQVVVWIALVLVGAKVMGALAQALKQPPVLGELLFGVLLGNLDLVGVTTFEPIRHDPTMQMLARLGIIILLFEVGLESTVSQMLRVGVASVLVAAIGVVTPFALGWAVSALVLPGASVYVHAFIGATLTATSVGITARVLQDLGRSQSREARIILGAAVIDDVLGLVVLAVMGGIVAAANAGTSLSPMAIALVIGKATGFLVGALVIGVLVSKRLFKLASRLQTSGVLLSVSLAFCFLLAFLADRVGLAPIVGAFAAGLILEDVHYADFVKRGEHELEELVKPLSTALAPLFFVMMGMDTNLTVFGSVKVLKLAGLLIVAAVVGKLACAIPAGRGTNRVAVAVGMIPRGEVGLVFANQGLQLTIAGTRLIDQDTFAAVVLMVIVTTFVTPPLLRLVLGKASDGDGDEAAKAAAAKVKPAPSA